MSAVFLHDCTMGADQLDGSPYLVASRDLEMVDIEGGDLIIRFHLYHSLLL
jgi:hypothetical protein